MFCALKSNPLLSAPHDDSERARDDDLTRMRARLSNDSTETLAEYAQSTRDIKTRPSKDEHWQGIAKPNLDMHEPQPELDGREEVRAVYDIIVAALRADSTWVLTYRQSVDSILSSIDVPCTVFDRSYYERSQGYKSGLAKAMVA